MKLLALLGVFSLLLVACAPAAPADAPPVVPESAALENTDLPTPTIVADAEAAPAEPMEPAVAIQTLSGAEFRTGEKPSVVYFMASWCPTCAQNWEVLSTVAPEYADRVQFVAVSIDPTDTEDVLSELSAEKDFQFQVSAGNPELALKHGVTRQTTTVVFNAQGEEVYRTSGGLSEAQWREVFERA